MPWGLGSWSLSGILGLIWDGWSIRRELNYWEPHQTIMRPELTLTLVWDLIGLDTALAPRSKDTLAEEAELCH